MVSRRPGQMCSHLACGLGYWDSSAGAPQWSPPAIGGSTAITIGIMTALFLLQWSPPVIGGSTRIHSRPVTRGRNAAMEPTGYRREHGHRQVQGHCRGSAAMEPAGYRREQRHAAGRPASRCPCRNGARRLSAGAALPPIGVCLHVCPPQWSPPVIGGSREPSALRKPARDCRNGARRLSTGAARRIRPP